MPMTTKTKIRVGVIVAAVILVLIIVLQNMQEVETQLLFMNVTMPRAVLLFVTMAVGFIAGMLTRGMLISAKVKKEP